jgi:cellulose synthase/poly-beta-1,6-N-acetylglucosamine synthase-like glycosyltransferase
MQDWLPGALAATGLAAAFYIVLGYPLLLKFGRGRNAPPVRKDLNYQPSVSAVIAVYNGAAQVAAKLDTLLALDYPADRFEIIIVSDGSTDATARIVRAYAERVGSGTGKPGIVLIEAPRGGKAASLNVGIARAAGEILFFTDVRQAMDPASLRHLAANFADPTVGAVTGEMHLRRGDSGEQADMDLYWRYEIWARTRHSEIDSLFNTTGCIYALRRSLAGPIPPDTLTDDAILPLRAFFEGYRVVFDPAAIAWDFPAVSGTEFRRRFRTLAGLCQVHARVPQLFGSRNRMRWHFLSHKFGRLALPWTLLLIFGATMSMRGSGLKAALLALEMAPLVLALLNGLVPQSFPLKRLCSPARTFLVMNAASFCAPAVFVLAAETIWKPTVTKQA